MILLTDYRMQIIFPLFVLLQIKIIAIYKQKKGLPLLLNTHAHKEKKHTFAHIAQISHASSCALGCNICFLSQGEQSQLHGNKLEEKKKDLLWQCFTFHPMSPRCVFIYLFFWGCS